MAVKLLTLKSTQTLIGEMDCTNENEIVLKKPVQVIVQPSKDGPMMAFAPFLEFCEEFEKGIKFPMEGVLCITTPLRGIENQYNKAFGAIAGLEIASTIPKA